MPWFMHSFDLFMFSQGLVERNFSLAKFWFKQGLANFFSLTKF